MARYRPQPRRRPVAAPAPANVTETANFRALDVGPVNGHRTPILWPPLVRS